MVVCNDDSKRSDGSDSADGNEGGRHFDGSATSWLVGEGIRHLHAADKEGELAYARVIELLRECKDAVETTAQLAQRVPADDVGLRWSLLQLRGDVGQPQAADFLVGAALARLPEHDPQQGCEGPRDGAVLLGTMAVEALQRVASRHEEIAELLLKVVAARPAQPILIEAIKAAADLGLRERLPDLLPKDDHWMLDIRRARIEEIAAEVEREDGRERGFTPPRGREAHTSPGTCGCHHREV